MSQIKSSQIQAGPQTTTDPTLVVTHDPAKPLAPGKYTFSLVVTDDLNQSSAPATFVVEVRSVPTVTLAGPPVVAPNTDITLTAKVTSTGAIKNFIWSVK